MRAVLQSTRFGNATYVIICVHKTLSTEVWLQGSVHRGLPTWVLVRQARRGSPLTSAKRRSIASKQSPCATKIISKTPSARSGLVKMDPFPNRAQIASIPPHKIMRPLWIRIPPFWVTETSICHKYVSMRKPRLASETAARN